MKIPVEFVEWKNWNNYLTNSLGNNNKVRYFESLDIKYELLKTLKKDISFIVVDDAYIDYKTVWYSFKIEECTIYEDCYGCQRLSKPSYLDTEEKRGYKVLIRMTSQKALNDHSLTDEGEVVRQLYKKLIGDYREDPDFRPKFSSISKARSEEIISNTNYKDKFGIKIELGDMVAHPSGTYGGGSWVHISEVTEFTINKVNGWIPERLVVVRAKDPNKKLGW